MVGNAHSLVVRWQHCNTSEEVLNVQLFGSSHRPHNLREKGSHFTADIAPE
jgi:hypothetical protein